ncbi:hypothetical protein VB636_01285, partial [Paracoccus sp. APAP_BH8]|uniref:hypothetical protein n=1 Tax=Paracoccus sp. APAP_BH8 TaxID=3110237 RepID=UPI002FD7E99B
HYRSDMERLLSIQEAGSIIAAALPRRGTKHGVSRRTDGREPFLGRGALPRLQQPRVAGAGR